MLVLLEVGAELVGADGGRKAVSSDPHGLVAVAEGGCPAGPGGRNLVVAVAAG